MIGFRKQLNCFDTIGSSGFLQALLANVHIHVELLGFVFIYFYLFSHLVLSRGSVNNRIVTGNASNTYFAPDLTSQIILL